MGIEEVLCDGRKIQLGWIEITTRYRACDQPHVAHVAMKVETIAATVLEGEADIEVTCLQEALFAGGGERHIQDAVDIVLRGRWVLERLHFAVDSQGRRFAFRDEEVRGLEALHGIEQVDDRDMAAFRHA